MFVRREHRRICHLCFGFPSNSHVIPEPLFSKDHESKLWSPLGFISPFSTNEKAGKPVRFGNPAIFKPHRFLWLFDYCGFTNPLLTLAKSRSSHLRMPDEIQRPVASGPTLTSGLALSIESILAQWEDMSKEKPDRTISPMRPFVVKLLFGSKHGLLLLEKRDVPFYLF